MPVYASNAPGRALFTVTPHPMGWAVLFEGDLLDPRQDKQEAIAAAHRRARACHDSGRAAQVRIDGDVTFAERHIDERRRTRPQ